MPTPRYPLPPRTRRARRALAAAALLVGLAPTTARAQFSLTRDLRVRGEWLQATASLSRRALPSHAAALAVGDGAGNAIQLGWMRAARDLSTVQGAFAGYERRIGAGPVLVTPGIALMGGEAKASVDTTGYDYTGAGDVRGRVPRYTFSRGAAGGAGITLGLELPVASRLALRLSAQQWFFGGTPVQGDASRLLGGAGLTICLGREGRGPTRSCRRTP